MANEGGLAEPTGEGQLALRFLADVFLAGVFDAFDEAPGWRL
jgi:hypothetical protein